MTRYPRLRIWWLATTAVACGLALTVTSASGGRAAAASCKTSGLVVWLDTRGGAAAQLDRGTAEPGRPRLGPLGSGGSCRFGGHIPAELDRAPG